MQCNMLVLTKGNRMFDLKCPYCDHPQNVCQDDGAHSEDGAIELMTCEKCEETFMVETSLHYNHKPILAPCVDNKEAECNSETIFRRTLISFGIPDGDKPFTVKEEIHCIACDKIHS